MLEPEFESIGNYRFAKWKTEPKPEALPTFSPMFFMAIGTAVAIILFSARLAVDQVRRGNFLVGNVWMFSFLGLLYLGPIVVMIVLKRMRKANRISPEPAPPHLPPHAIQVLVRSKTQSGSRGSSSGWLWVDGEWLHFSGEGFDFKLRPSDFTSKGDTIQILRRGWSSIRTPDKISATVLYMFPFRKAGDKSLSTPEAWDRLAPALETWLRAPKSNALPLFPPLRSNVAKLGFRPILRPAFVTAALSSLLGLSVSLTLPSDPPNHSPLFFSGITALMGFFLVMTLPLQSQATHTFDKEIEKARDAEAAGPGSPS